MSVERTLAQRASRPPGPPPFTTRPVLPRGDPHVDRGARAGARCSIRGGIWGAEGSSF